MTENQDIIREIEDRARGAKLSIGELCRRAGIARSTYTRWKSGDSTPQMRVYRKLLATLDAAESMAA